MRQILKLENSFIRKRRSVLKNGIVALTLLLTAFNLQATVRLPSLLGSNMVLQQRSEVNLWGWADPAEKVYITASWRDGVDSATTDEYARWKVKIKTPVAGGPYTITIKGSANTLVLENVMIGEVWVCSGQSNMEWCSVQHHQQIIDEMPNSNNANLRLMQIPKIASAYPQDDVYGSWKVSSPEVVKGFSSVGYFFAKKLQQSLGIPVGIINASWGGTPAEVWTPNEVVESNLHLKTNADKLTKTPWWPIKSGATYNTMIYPLTNLAIAGAIWYQGESNVGYFQTYSKLMTEMIGAWRNAWNKDFPFYYVQIAPFQYGPKNSGAMLREQQTMALSCPNTGMVVISDLVDDVNNIHPKDKIGVADRLANMALAETYHKNTDMAYQSPFFQKMEIANDKATLYFSNAEDGFITKDGKKPTEFFIAGIDRNFLPAEVKLDKGKIVVWNKSVTRPVAVRFSFTNAGISNLLSKGGLPVAPFRTDNWVEESFAE